MAKPAAAALLVLVAVVWGVWLGLLTQRWWVGVLVGLATLAINIAGRSWLTRRNGDDVGRTFQR